MAYTSEQYKYLLLKRMQRHFSLDSVEDRNYTYTFFGKLLDDSVTLTEESYRTFVDLMDDELAYCAENNIYDCDDLPSDYIDEHSLLLINAFAAIGITLEITQPTFADLSGRATFTKPNGEVMVYKVTSTTNFFHINSKAGTEYSYAKRSAPYYNMENMDVLELDDTEINRCGIGCYWRYNADTATITISGDGFYHKATTETQVGSGAYTTIVIGANVSRLAQNALNLTAIKTVVLLHAADFPLVMEAVVGANSSYAWTVYADNEVFRNYAWGSDMNITWHSLDEWEG